MVKTHVFEQSCIAAAKTFGRKHNISVVFRGTDAKTDGTTIQLPALDQTKELTERQVSIGRGYVDHEAGHIKHTDRKVWVNAIKQAVDCGDTQLPALMNALEDVRIERLINDEYAGSKYNLQTTAQAVNGGYLKMYENDNTIADDITKVGAVAVTWEGRQRLGYNSDNDKCLDTLPKQIRDKVENWVDMVDGMRDTKDMVTCAISIANMIRKEKGEEELPKKIADAMISGTDLGMGKTLEGSESDTKPDGNEPSKHNSDFKNHEGRHGSSINKSGMSDDPIDPSLDIQKELGVKEWTGSVDYDINKFTVQAKSSDKIHHATDKKGKYKNYYDEDETYGLTMALDGGDEKYKKVFNMLGNQMGVMRRKLERALMSQQMRGWESGHEVGRLDSKRLVGAYQGVPNIYKIRENVKELDTAVSVVVDHSGSMSGDKMRLAMQSCIALCESIHKCGCSLEILGFATGSNYNEQDYRAVGYSRRDYGRTQPIDTYVYKSFDDRMNDARRPLGNMLRVASNHGSCNADGCSVLVATERLLERQERRKVMIVLSDGYPQHHGHSTESSNIWLRDVIDYAIKKGIDIMGIGINSNAVKRFYPDYVVVQDINELSKTVMDKLAKRLLGERFVIDNADLIKGNARAVR
tara:strand:+ start:3195 stop:5105 length:1911 start_codon:yes stop_codon:yes gene_type:complete